MHARKIDTITVEEYLEAERDAELRHEYVYGEVFALAGGSVNHNLITSNLVRALGNAAETTACRVYSSDMKLRTLEAVFYYPDVMVVCRPPADPYFETDPCVIVEVVSQSTSRKDQLEKRFAYLKLPGLRLYLLVDSRQRKATGYYRTAGGWEERSFDEGDEVSVPCLEVILSFSQLYHKVHFERGEL